MISDTEIEAQAELYASNKGGYSVNKHDLKAGYIAGAKTMRKLMSLMGEARPEKENMDLVKDAFSKNRFDY